MVRDGVLAKCDPKRVALQNANDTGAVSCKTQLKQGELGSNKGGRVLQLVLYKDRGNPKGMSIMTLLKKMALMLCATLALVLPRVAAAQEAVLTVINTLTDTEVTLSDAELMALPQATVNTENEFVDAMTAFQGPLGRDVLALAGEGGSMVILTAVNDYAVEVPIEDFVNYDVVFAMSADGVAFSRRDKGPIWVVYPMSDHAELQDPVYNARLIWQLVKVEIK